MNQTHALELEDISDDTDDTDLIPQPLIQGSVQGPKHSLSPPAVIEFRYQAQTTSQERARELLGESGLPAHVVAATLGVTPGYISQLLADANFAYDVQTLRFKRTQSYAKRDEKIEAIEDKLLEKIATSVKFANKLPELTKAFQVMNAAKRRGTVDVNDSGLTTGVTITLTMPKTTVNTYQVRLDVNNNVVEAGSQSMHTATLKDVVTLVTERASTENRLGYNNVGAEDVTPRFSTTGESKATSQGQDLSSDDI